MSQTDWVCCEIHHKSGNTMSGFWTFLLWLVILVSQVTPGQTVSRPTAISLDNNGYTGLLVAISPDVPQDAGLIDKIKAMMKEASSYLYSATAKRAYFSHVTILVPHTWAPDPAWGPATSELYTNADVIVQDPPNQRRRRSNPPEDQSDPGAWPKHRTVASTRSYGGCGVSGVRINIFTNMFGRFSKYPGRLFVHEWAKFRWGVFEEFAREGEQQFYFSPTTGNLEAVRCNIHMVGRIYRVNPASGRAELCHVVDPDTGMYDERCVFSPYTLGRYNDNITASIMDRQFVPTVTEFCNDDRSDSKRVHNYESPSRHNRLCGSRSTWDVIQGSTDFANGANPPREVPDTNPVFKVVRTAAARRMVLALDASTSMEENGKLRRARQAVSSFIEDSLHDDVSLGVVSFAHQAQLVSPVQKLRSQRERRSISDRLPVLGQGATSVGAAVLKAIEVLEHHDRNGTNAFVVVITDGKETSYPSLLDVMQNVTNAGAVVSIISFTDEGESSLKHLALSTGGRFYLDSDQGDAASTLGALLSVYRLLDSGAGLRVPRQVLSHAQTLRRNDHMTGSFRIDASLGNQTTAIVTYSTITAPDVTVVSPSGRKYMSLYPEYHLQPGLRKIKIRIPDSAEMGTWRYWVSNNREASNMRASLTVLSSERDVLSPALHLTGSLVVTNASWPIKAAIYAEVTKGSRPLAGLKVKATVLRPMGDAVELNLYDGGAGADIERDDGIYSRFFTQFSTSGRYSLILGVSDWAGVDRLASHLDPLPVFLDSTFAGSVHVEHPKLSGGIDALAVETDCYPPIRITDLRVLHTSGRDRTVTLAWTAPGDDNDFDKASEYVIVSSSDAESLMRSTGSKPLPALPRSAVIVGDLARPRPFGETEMITLKLDSNLNGLPSGQVLAVLAVDEAGNRAELSNLVTVGLGLAPDVTTPEFLTSQNQKVKIPQESGVSDQTLAGMVGVAGSLLMVTFLGTVLVYAMMGAGCVGREGEGKGGWQERSAIV